MYTCLYHRNSHFNSKCLILCYEISSTIHGVGAQGTIVCNCDIFTSIAISNYPWIAEVHSYKYLDIYLTLARLIALKNLVIMPALSSSVTPQLVIMTTCTVASEDKVDIITTLFLACFLLFWLQPQTLIRSVYNNPFATTLCAGWFIMEKDESVNSYNFLQKTHKQIWYVCYRP